MPNDPIELPVEISNPGTWVLSRWTANKFDAACGLRDSSLCLLLGGSSATDLALGNPLDLTKSDIDFYFQGKDALTRNAVDCMREVVGSRLAKILGFHESAIVQWKTKYTDNLDPSKSYYLITMPPIDYNIGTRVIYSNFQISIDVETGLRVYDPNIPSHESDFADFEKNKEIMTYKIENLIQNTTDQKGFSTLAFVIKSYIKHVEAGYHFSEETAEAIRNIKKYNPALMKSIEQRITAFYGLSSHQVTSVFDRAENDYNKTKLNEKNQKQALIDKLALKEQEQATLEKTNKELTVALEKTKETLAAASQNAEKDKKSINDARALLGNVRAQAAKEKLEIEGQLEKQNKAMHEQNRQLEKMNVTLKKQIESNEIIKEKLQAVIPEQKRRVQEDQAIGARIIAAVHVWKTQETTAAVAILTENLYSQAGLHMEALEKNSDKSEQCLFAMARESLACIHSEIEMIGFLSLFREMKEFDEKHDLFQRLDFRVLHSLELSANGVKMPFDQRLQLITGSLFAFIKMVEIGFVRKCPSIDQRMPALKELYMKLKNDKGYAESLELLDKKLSHFKTSIRSELKAKLPSFSDEILKNSFNHPENGLTKFIANYKALRMQSGDPSAADLYMAMNLELTKSGDLKEFRHLETLYDQCMREMLDASLKQVAQKKPLLVVASSSSTAHLLQHSKPSKEGGAKAFLNEYCGKEEAGKIQAKKINELDNFMFEFEPKKLACLGRMLGSVENNKLHERWDAAHSIARSFSSGNQFEKDFKKFSDFFLKLFQKNIITESKHANICEIMRRTQLINPLAEALKKHNKDIATLERMSQFQNLESTNEFEQVVTALTPLARSFKADELQYILLLVAYEDRDCSDKKISMLHVAQRLLKKISETSELSQSLPSACKK
jgi:hypothetical protein